MTVLADSTVLKINDSNIDFDMGSTGTNCFEVHNRSHPHFIVIFLVICYGFFNLLSRKLISKDEEILKMLTLILTCTFHLTVVIHILLYVLITFH